MLQTVERRGLRRDERKASAAFFIHMEPNTESIKKIKNSTLVDRQKPMRCAEKSYGSISIPIES